MLYLNIQRSKYRTTFLLLAIMLSLGFFFRCNKNKDSNNATSKGDINHLTIIVSDHLWNGEVGDSLRKKFAGPVDGLQQEEPLFTIDQFNNKFLDNQTAFNRNIIIVKKEEKNSYRFIKNQYANPQNIAYISGNNVDEIIDYIERYGDSLVDVFKKTELKRQQDITRNSLLDDSKIREKFQIKLDIPKSYNLVLEKKSFLWLKKEILGGNTSLLIYRVPFRTLLKDDDIVNHIIAMRDIVGAKYIKGKLPNTRMITEESYAPYFFNTVIAERRTYETKGTWELKGDYMSGSFINYAIMDRDKKEFLILEGFTYAPSTTKRDLMHELEAIIKSVEFLNDKND